MHIIYNHNKIKHEMEIAAIEVFIKRYYELFNIKYELVEKRESPDAIISDETGKKFGLEIAHLFLNSEEAKRVLDIEYRKIIQPKRLIEYINVLNKLLKKKEVKWYKYELEYPIFLVIRITSPLFTYEAVKFNNDNISIPKIAYKNIWLLVDNGNTTKGSIDLLKLK